MESCLRRTLEGNRDGGGRDAGFAAVDTRTSPTTRRKGSTDTMTSPTRRQAVSSQSSPSRQRAIKDSSRSDAGRTMKDVTTATLTSPAKLTGRSALASLDVNVRGSKRAFTSEDSKGKKSTKRMKLDEEEEEDDYDDEDEDEDDDENENEDGEDDMERKRGKVGRMSDDGGDSSSSSSSSPEASSVFDTSVADASWATAATHEVEAATEAVPRRRLTREQMREAYE
ncbi:hypothetical protein CP532_5161 [Ophiocordyceps camponoti-leonardi (nom. inval.)]|nr:hypothetical protein CP532_5161 [Ophiocordyceps camponoti-leonardi (nom. inval.)]